MDQITAIVLAAGHGKRMNSGVRKQYMLLKDKPVLYYSLKALEESEVDSIILVVGEQELTEVREQMVEQYQFHKIKKVIAGGLERYLSVYCGLQQVENAAYVLIHDGARPLVSTELINRVIEEVKSHNACIVGVPSKDTVKLVNDTNIVTATPERNCVWMIQTPQAFAYPLIKEAYDRFIESGDSNVTDDAMVLERCNQTPIHMVTGSYNNIKITTPEDIQIAEVLLELSNVSQG